MDFREYEIFNIMLEAQESGVSVIDVLGESISGYLDLKLELDYNCLYNINGIYYNSNEVGNYMWSFMLRLNEYPQYFDGFLAQTG